LPGYEVARGVALLRALPVWSERLGLSGKCDIVEVMPSAECGVRNVESKLEPAVPSAESGMRSAESLVPVDYKKGKRRQFENDDAQLCAQAMCLEEMLGRPVERGAVLHAASKRRREAVGS
jgi:CRISPR-associated exonuclease Cas4